MGHSLVVVDFLLAGILEAFSRERLSVKLFRYRRPSLKTVLGVTTAKKQIKKDLGITALLKPFRWWPNQKRRVKRKLGYESRAGRLVRQGLPKPGGCLAVIVGMIGAFGSWLFA
jgi:hypothetical protein